METAESIKIIEQMLNESRQSLAKYSFHFILWSLVLIPCGILEWYFGNSPNRVLAWPIASVLGGVIAGIYGYKQSKLVSVKTLSDRVYGFVWGGFGLSMIFCIFYSIKLNVPPHTLILLSSGVATFITGGLSKFKPLIIGGLFLTAMAALCGFVIEPQFQGLIFALGLFGGYLVPGVMLRKLENA